MDSVKSPMGDLCVSLVRGVPGGSGRLPFSRGAGRSAEVDLGRSPGLMWLAGLMVPDVPWRGSSG